MKNKIAIALSVVTISTLGLLSSSNGVAEVQNQDRTGAPGSAQACTLCHQAGSTLNASNSITVTGADGLVADHWIAGETYEVSFVVTGTGAAGYGFQATSVLADGSNAGSFTNPGASTQLESVGSRHIVEHSSPSSTGIFTATWTAPPEGSGDVGFFMAGIAANLQDGNNGDSHDETAISLPELNLAVSDLVAMNQPIISSNGVTLKANVNGTLSIYDLSGRVSFSSEVSSQETIQVDAGELGRGIQIIRFNPKTGSKSNYTPQTWKIVIPS
ncbi:MAG: hypothetical protein COA49_09590 [Bacteroidetes bacterium]|nr:MAG: hypothetical protein COA49_09590 [Bacteroidota bacterium]